MSGWSAYAEAIKATGHCDNAALIGIQGGVWGTSEGFNLAAGKLLFFCIAINKSFVVIIG